VKRAYEPNPKAVEQWCQTVYPQIQARAKEEKAEIHSDDETGIRNNEYAARGLTSQGRPPVVRIHATKSRINMILSISNRSQVRFVGYQETLTAQVLIQFLSRLIKSSERKAFLILDNLQVHHSRAVKKWLETKKEQIEVFYLPSDSPELNPDAYLNSDLKQNIRSGLPVRSEKTLTKKTPPFMRTLQNRPERVRHYFNHPQIAYAA